MSKPFVPVIAIYGLDEAPNTKRTGCALWPAGYAASVTAAGGTPQSIDVPRRGQSWEDVLEGTHGMVFVGAYPNTPARVSAELALFETCRELKIPVLGVDQGM